MAAFQNAFELLSRKFTVADLHIQPKVKDERLSAILELLSKTSVYDVLDYLEALKNAVDHEKKQKIIALGWKVKDLDITVL